VLEARRDSISTDPAGDNVRALAALLLKAPGSDHMANLAVEAARRMIDFERVREAHRLLYARFGNVPALTILPSQSTAELNGLAEIAAGFIKGLQPPKAPPLTITDLAKQLGKLARYERRILSLRERALGELADAIAGACLQVGLRSQSDR
jgi:hypothetical protein